MTMRLAVLLLLILLGCGSVTHSSPRSDSSVSDGGRPRREGGLADTGTPHREAGPRDGGASPGDACPSDEAGAGPCNTETLASCDPLTPCACGGCCIAGICAPQGAACAQNLGICHERSCGGCGALGQPCCSAPNQRLYGDPCGTNPPGSAGWWSGPACSDPNTVCTDFDAAPNRCVPCGAAGQPCCEALNHASQGVCGSLQLVCGADGTCTASCDHLGEPCCEDGDCHDGTVCMGYPSGMNACVAASSCGADDAGSCATCGVAGVACCGDGGCVVGRCASGECYVNRMR